MSDHRPPLFADGDITPPRGTPATSPAGNDDRGPSEWDEWDDDEWDEPNYLVRRALIVAAVVGVVALVAIGASRFIGTGSDSPQRAGSEWNTIVVVTEDAITLFDKDGDEVEQFDGEFLDDQIEVMGNTLITIDDTGRVVMTSLEDGTMRTDRVERDATLRASSGNRSIAIADQSGGGDVALIDAGDGQVVSIADVADLSDPLIFGIDVLINAAGTHAAAPVPRLFQSFLIDIKNEESTALAGRVIAIDDERVVTEQPAGDESEIEFYDLTGERLGSIDVPAPEATVLTNDGSLLMITADGAISRATPDETDDIGQLTTADAAAIDVTSAVLTSNGERIVVNASGTMFVLDADGTQLGSAIGSPSAPITADSRCISLRSGTTADVVDLESASVVASVERGFINMTSADGCTGSVNGSVDPTIVRDGVIIDIDADGVIAIAPDGSKFVVVDRRVSDLANFENDDTVELTDERPVIRFGQR